MKCKHDYHVTETMNKRYVGCLIVDQILDLRDVDYEEVLVQLYIHYIKGNYDKGFDIKICLECDKIIDEGKIYADKHEEYLKFVVKEIKLKLDRKRNVELKYNKIKTENEKWTNDFDIALKEL